MLKKISPLTVSLHTITAATRNALMRIHKHISNQPPTFTLQEESVSPSICLCLPFSSQSFAFSTNGGNYVSVQCRIENSSKLISLWLIYINSVKSIYSDTNLFFMMISFQNISTLSEMNKVMGTFKTPMNNSLIVFFFFFF